MTNPDDVTPLSPSPTVRLPLVEAASRLGLTAAALRSRVRRGAVKAIRGNSGQLLVEVPADAPVRHDPAMTGPDDELTAEVAELREQVAELQTELLTATVAAARAEERAAAVRELADRLTAELAEARRPWWRRLLASRETGS